MKTMIKRFVIDLTGNRTYDRQNVTVVYNVHDEPVLIIKELVYDDDNGHEVIGACFSEAIDRFRRLSICNLLDFC